MTESSVLFALLRHQICGEKVSEEVKNALTPEILSMNRPALFWKKQKFPLYH